MTFDDSIDDAVRELAASAVLCHPNICVPTNACRGDREMRLTMPLARSSLSNHVHGIVAGGGSNAYKDWVNVWHKHIIYALCCALKHMHDKGIAHRDLKMSNVLVVSKDWDLQGVEDLTSPLPLQVCDFGLCRAHNKHTEASSAPPLTFTECGSIPYLSPETVLGCDESDLVATDVWGIGFISLVLFAGTKQRLGKMDDVAALLFHPQQGICSGVFRRSKWTKAKNKSVVDDICSWQKGLENDPNRRLKIDDDQGWNEDDLERNEDDLEGWFSVVEGYKNSRDPLATFIYERVLSVHPDDRCTVDDILNFIRPPPLTTDNSLMANDNPTTADSIIANNK
jgi:15 Serine/threonine protein kinase